MNPRIQKLSRFSNKIRPVLIISAFLLIFFSVQEMGDLPGRVEDAGTHTFFAENWYTKTRTGHSGKRKVTYKNYYVKMKSGKYFYTRTASGMNDAKSSVSRNEKIVKRVFTVPGSNKYFVAEPEENPQSFLFHLRFRYAVLLGSASLYLLFAALCRLLLGWSRLSLPSLYNREGEKLNLTRLCDPNMNRRTEAVSVLQKQAGLSTGEAEDTVEQVYRLLHRKAVMSAWTLLPALLLLIAFVLRALRLY